MPVLLILLLLQLHLLLLELMFFQRLASKFADIGSLGRASDFLLSIHVHWPSKLLLLEHTVSLSLTKRGSTLTIWHSKAREHLRLLRNKTHIVKSYRASNPLRSWFHPMTWC